MPVQTVTSEPLAEIAQRLDCREIAARVWGAGRRSGKAVMYTAPRGEKTPSFAVYANGAKDFGNGETFTTVGFIALALGIDLETAKDTARRWAGGIIPERNVTARASNTRSGQKSGQDGAWQRKAAQRLASAQHTLASERGRSGREYLIGRGISEESARAAGLGYERDFTYRNGAGALAQSRAVLIGWRDSGGALVAVRARLLDAQSGDKYRSVVGSALGGACYIAGEFRPERPTLIVEGEFDAILAAQSIGGAANVITFGSASATLPAQWVELLAKCPAVLVATDNDSAGEMAAQRLRAVLPSAARAALPSGKDVTDFWRAGGDIAAWYRAALAQHFPAFPLTLFTVAALLNIGARNAAKVYALWAMAINAGAIDARAALALGELQSVAQRLGVVMPVATFRRGLREGKGMVFTAPLNDESDSDSNYGQSILSESDSCPPSARYRLMPPAQSNAPDSLLSERLARALLERFYPPSLGVLPALSERYGNVALLDALSAKFGLEIDESDRALYDELAAQQDDQKAAIAGKYLSRARAQFEQWRRSGRGAGALGGAWYEGVNIEGSLLRAQHDSGARSLSRFQMSLITGVAAQNLAPALRRAGLVQCRPAPEMVALNVERPERVKVAACQAAKGRGLVLGIVALSDNGQDEERPLNAPDFGRWAAGMKEKGAAFYAKINPSAAQSAIAPPAPPSYESLVIADQVAKYGAVAITERPERASAAQPPVAQSAALVAALVAVAPRSLWALVAAPLVAAQSAAQKRRPRYRSWLDYVWHELNARADRLSAVNLESSEGRGEMTIVV